MMKILFVCLGNICRSPAAEATFRQLCQQQGTEQRFTWDSAGTAAYHIGKAPDKRMCEAAQVRGMAMDDLRARQVKVSDFYEYDMIIAMDKSNLDNLLSIRPDDSSADVKLMLDYIDSGQAEVPDPYYGDEDGFYQVLDLLDTACRNLHNKYC